MNYEVVELEDLSGNEAAIYSIIMEGDDDTLFEQFLTEYQQTYQQEVKNILDRIRSIGHEVGARYDFFKHKEGKPGDGVCALYDIPGTNLRLYCIRYDCVTVLLGSGGPKPEGVVAWQDDERLTIEAERMISVSKDIMDRVRNKELKLVPHKTENRSEFIGELNFGNYEE